MFRREQLNPPGLHLRRQPHAHLLFAQTESIRASGPSSSSGWSGSRGGRSSSSSAARRVTSSTPGPVTRKRAARSWPTRRRCAAACRDRRRGLPRMCGRCPTGNKRRGHAPISRRNTCGDVGLRHARVNLFHRQVGITGNQRQRRRRELFARRHLDARHAVDDARRVLQSAQQRMAAARRRARAADRRSASAPRCGRRSPRRTDRPGRSSFASRPTRRRGSSRESRPSRRRAVTKARS